MRVTKATLEARITDLEAEVAKRDRRIAQLQGRRDQARDRAIRARPQVAELSLALTELIHDLERDEGRP